MSWRDRDYRDESYDTLSSPWRVQRPPRGTLALMIVHGAAFLLFVLLQSREPESAAMLVLSDTPHPLSVFLHPFASGSLLTAIFVVLTLWSLAGRLEPRLGTLRLVIVYCISNLAAGIVFFLLGRLAPQLARLPMIYPVGGLAGLVALAWHQSRFEPVQVLGRTTTLGKVYLITALVVVLLAILPDITGSPAWLLAAGAGTAAALGVERLPGLAFRPRSRRVVRPSRVARDPDDDDEGDVDDLLAKISRSGLASLTPAERARLESARRARLRRG